IPSAQSSALPDSSSFPDGFFPGPFPKGGRRPFSSESGRRNRSDLGKRRALLAPKIGEFFSFRQRARGGIPEEPLYSLWEPSPLKRGDALPRQSSSNTSRRRLPHGVQARALERGLFRTGSGKTQAAPFLRPLPYLPTRE